MRRGDIASVAAGGGFGGKPRPAVIVQSDFFPETQTVTVVLLTTQPVRASTLRVEIQRSLANGLARRSWAMIDKIITLRRDKVGRVFGRLEPELLVRIERALAVFLGLDTSPPK